MNVPADSLVAPLPVTLAPAAPVPLAQVRVAPNPLAPAGCELFTSAAPFYGRSAAEYMLSFGLDRPALEDLAVLDVGAGPSSFAVESCRRGLEVVALDPLYGCPLDTLATHIQLDYARLGVESCRRLQGSRLAARVALEQDRRAAAQRFLGDYESGFLHNRYVGGALPRLPFLDRSFDLVLCGHLIFESRAGLSGDALVPALRELVRVAAREVRVSPFPIAAETGAGAALKSLSREGIATELRPLRVGTRFSRTAHVLVLRTAER